MFVQQSLSRYFAFFLIFIVFFSFLAPGTPGRIFAAEQGDPALAGLRPLLLGLPLPAVPPPSLPAPLAHSIWIEVEMTRFFLGSM